MLIQHFQLLRNVYVIFLLKAPKKRGLPVLSSICYSNYVKSTGPWTGHNFKWDLFGVLAKELSEIH